MKKQCDFFNYKQGDCRFGPNNCACGYSGCPVILDEDEEEEELCEVNCEFCKNERGLKGYFCENKNSEWYGEHCIESDKCEPMECSDKIEKGD